MDLYLSAGEVISPPELVLLVVNALLSYRNQRSQQPESQYDSINATEAAKLLQPAEDNTYAETRNNVRKKAPKVELAEYVNVDNSGRKVAKMN